MPLEPGLAATVELTVKEGDTAEALRSGEVPMLATPRLVALAEEATCLALDGALEPNMTSVGMKVRMNHLVPVPVGGSVRAEAKLEKVEGRRLGFTVSITNDQGLVAAARITRVVVNRDRFIEKARSPHDGDRSALAE